MNKFKFIVFFMAALAMFSCKQKNEPKEDDPISGGFKSLISVNDYTLSDWDKVPAEYLYVLRKDPAATVYAGLDSIYVYADKYYLNLQVWYRPDSLSKRDLIPFHIYLDADNNANTGGYDDYFLDGTAEVMLEGFLFQTNQPVVFNPAMFIWWGANGTGISDQSQKSGWYWTNPAITPSQENGWGAIIPTASREVASSQALNANKVFEIQIKRQEVINAMNGITDRSLVGDWSWATTFGLGFDLEMQVGEKGTTDVPWVLKGLLPNMIEDEFQFPVKQPKVKINIDPNKYQ